MAAVRRWTVRSDPTDCGWFAWFYVFVYQTHDELRRAATKYSPGEGPNYFVHAAACFQPRYTVRYDKRGKPQRCANTAFLGVMRLSMERLEPLVVIHESTHAAIQYVRALKLKDQFMLGTNLATEEAICYATHEFSTALLLKLEMIKA